jgi:hypothetical protein
MNAQLDVSVEHGTDNRRRHTRSEVRAVVMWDHRAREADTGTILDVSASGLLLTGAFGVPEDVQVGDPVWGHFRIGAAEHHFAGVVRWKGYSQRYECEGVGLEFNELTPLARADLEAFVARHAMP